MDSLKFNFWLEAKAIFLEIPLFKVDNWYDVKSILAELRFRTSMFKITSEFGAAFGVLAETSRYKPVQASIMVLISFVLTVFQCLLSNFWINL